jgi:hypothetical protein
MELMMKLIGEVEITCECGAVYRVPAFGVFPKRHAGWKYVLMPWKTPYAIPLDESEGFPLREHGMHLIKKFRLIKSKELADKWVERLKKEKTISGEEPIRESIRE